MGRGAWQATVHGVAKNQTQLNQGAHKQAILMRWIHSGETLLNATVRAEGVLPPSPLG